MLIIDSREQNPYLLAHADGKRLLAYEGPNGEAFSYDFEVTLRTGQVLKVERKAWPDFVQSWVGKKLDRQATNTDLLIVERSLDEFLAGGADPELDDRAEKHLALLQLLMPVLESKGPEDTMAKLRYLEGRDEGLAVRANKLASSAPNVRWRILEALPGINPYRQMGDGRRLGDHLEELAFWGNLADNLRMHEWAVLPWEGPVPRAAIQKARLALVEG